MINKSLEEILHNNVTAGGGSWLGVQTSIPPEPDRVIFKSMITQRTISLFVDKCTIAAVQHAIAQDAKKDNNKPIQLTRNDLFEFAGTLKRMEEFINELLEEKE